MSKFKVKQVKERRDVGILKQGCLNSVKVEQDQKSKAPVLKIKQVKERRDVGIAKQGCLNSVKVKK